MIVLARWRRWRPLILAAALAGSFATATGAQLASGRPIDDPGLGFSILLFDGIAVLLVARRPGNRVSWLIAGLAVLASLALLAAAVTPPENTRAGGGGPFEASTLQLVANGLGGGAWYGFLAVVGVLLPLHFPNGTPPSPRWRWISWATIGATGMMAVLWALQARFCVSQQGDVCVLFADNPIGVGFIENPEQSAVGALILATLAICMAGAVISIFVRFRRSTGAERQQLKWVAFAVSGSLGFLLLIDIGWVGGLGFAEPPGYAAVQSLLWVAIPGAIAIAILRHRLFDIDRIISRTISYICVTSISLALFAIVAVAPSRLLGSRDAPPVLIAIATLTVAGLFTPLRRRVQAVVDRRFNRARYDAQLVVDGFATRLRDPRDLELVTADLAGTVAAAMHPERLGMWVRP